MAPRRGGGGGSYSSGGSIDNQCADYGAFHDGYSQAQIAIYGVILLFFLILALCTAKSSAKRKKNNRRRTILRWFHYGIALFLVISSFIILIVRYVLEECRVIYYFGYEYTGMSVAVFTIFNLADLFLLALVLFVVTWRLFQLAGSESLRRVFLIFSIIYFTIVSILFVARVIMNGVLSYQDYVTYRTAKSYEQLTKAYFIMFCIMAIFASIVLVIAAGKLWKKPERRVGIIGWIPVLIVGILCYTIYNVANVFIIYEVDYPDPIGSLVGYGISLLGYFIAFFAIFMIARGTGWDYLDDGHANVASTPYNTYASTATAPHTQPIGGYPVHAPYLGTAQVPITDPKRTSYPASTTPAPPYAATGMPYSGGGVYGQQQQTYSGNWSQGTGGYTSPVHPVSTPSPAPYHNAAFGVANRGLEPTELAART
ncbi:hypothetical protein ABW21_db0203413 [Orbilia brochopaga]|nr:hypothetical protein ABW21_db0203413 [Drechslerella brochopaga]